MMEAMVSLGTVLSICSETANTAVAMICNVIMVLKENPIGMMGLKRQIMVTKAAAHQYLRRFTACIKTNTAAAVITKFK
jgi:hypothetical protein